MLENQNYEGSLQKTQMTADHKVLNEEAESRNNHRYVFVVQDLATQWIQSHPCKNKKFAGDGKEFTKDSRAVAEAKSHYTPRSYMA